MNYISLNIAFSDDLQAEILTAELADYPFESFEADAGTLKAYIPQERLADCKGEVDALLARYGVQGRYIAIETQNWNAVWESNFPPVDVEGRLLIRAPFHEPAPAGVMEVVVMPKMSFGTGHHATTWLVSRAVLDLGVAGRRGLDMGSGTGVLSIVAAKCGAEHVDAVDIVRVEEVHVVANYTIDNIQWLCLLVDRSLSTNLDIEACTCTATRLCDVDTRNRTLQRLCKIGSTTSGYLF